MTLEYYALFAPDAAGEGDRFVDGYTTVASAIDGAVEHYINHLTSAPEHEDEQDLYEESWSYDPSTHDYTWRGYIVQLRQVKS